VKARGKKCIAEVNKDETTTTTTKCQKGGNLGLSRSYYEKKLKNKVSGEGKVT